MQFTHLNLQELSLNIEGRRSTWFDIFQPPPRRTLSEWTEEFRVLGSASSAEPGRFRVSRAEYQRGILDAISDPLIEEVVIMSSAQVGKSEILLCAIGYFIDQMPSPSMCLQPTLQMCEAFSKDRIAPMIQLSPALRNKVKDPRARDSNNTLLHKGFTGGHLTLAASNSPAGLSSRPVKNLFLDEVDRYPASAGSEGDPVNLARARTTNFLNRKIVLTSTPTTKGISRIEIAYESSDQRIYQVPCPKCQEPQRLLWKNVKWEGDKAETAAYYCEKCGEPWTDVERWKAVSLGKWKITNPSSKTAGFHLSALYSPWSQLEKLVEQFLHARELPELLKTFVNTVLGESFEDEGEGVEPLGLFQRREKYEFECPLEVKVICSGIDTQDDRLEITHAGYTEKGECWILDHRIILEDPSTPGAWSLLTEELRRTFKQGEHSMRSRIACIDSGGHFTQTVYQYCKQTKGVYPIKGVGGFGRPIVGRPSKNNQLRVSLYSIGVDTAKELIYSRLRQENVGPGYIHFPEHLDEEYFKQVSSERIQKRIYKGFLKREFVKAYARNEGLDCMVYSLAGFLMLSPSMIQQQKKIKFVKDQETKEIEEKELDTPKPRRGRRVKFQKSAW